MNDQKQFDEMSWDDFCKLFDWLCSNYRADLDTNVRLLWWRYMKWWAGTDVREAFRIVMEDNKFFPTLSEMRAAKPVKHKRIEDIERDNGLIDWMNQENPDQINTTADLEERINRIVNDRDVAAASAVFATLNHRCFDQEKAVAWTVREFFNHPDGIYRSVFRDILRKIPEQKIVHVPKNIEFKPSDPPERGREEQALPSIEGFGFVD